jgi:fructosamine-3-kinase
MNLIDQLCNRITAVTGSDFVLDSHHSIGGGCINTAYRLDGNNESYFVKINQNNLLHMFEAEAAGLQAMADTRSIRVPQPVDHGVIDGHSYLIMEYLPLGGHGSSDLLGEQLAQLHRNRHAQFGFSCDNTIGSTPQPNTPENDWVSFWQQQRLGFQLQHARQKGYGGPLQSEGEKLLELVPAFFTDYRPQPSLLHGDLWSGNYSYTQEGEPVIFDPATYYGDREADIAMTELFGGFGSSFYSAYNNAWALDAGYSTRKILYNLYHIINHLNLFGGGYKGQAESMISRLLSEAR